MTISAWPEERNITPSERFIGGNEDIVEVLVVTLWRWACQHNGPCYSDGDRLHCSQPPMPVVLHPRRLSACQPEMDGGPQWDPGRLLAGSDILSYFKGIPEVR